MNNKYLLTYYEVPDAMTSTGQLLAMDYDICNESEIESIVSNWQKNKKRLYGSNTTFDFDCLLDNHCYSVFQDEYSRDNGKPSACLTFVKLESSFLKKLT